MSEEESAEERIAALEKKLQDMKEAMEKAMPAEAAEAVPAEAVPAETVPVEAAEAAPADDMLAAFQKGMAAKASEPKKAPPPPPSPPEVFEPFPLPGPIGVKGQRCAVIFYAYDGIPKAEQLLDAFEDEAAEYAACGCALVGVRKVVTGDSADERKAAEYESRFPSFNFVDGLESLAIELAINSNVLAANGLDNEWKRSLYNEPLVVLLEPDGGMRTVLSHKGLSAVNVLGQITRDLHIAVPREDARISSAEAEVNRQALYNENVQWAEVLKEDESLRQPTRYWFDGLLQGRDNKPLLGGVENAALPEAIEQYLAGDGEADEEEEEVELFSKDGVKAPAWYAKAKQTAEKKQEAERKLWNGTAPSASAGPLPLGPPGRTFEPLQQYTNKALAQADAQQKKLVSAFFRDFGGERFKFLSGGEPGDALDESGSTPAAPAAPRTATTESALLRAEMLALGLSRSATSGQSTRRLRLLRELEASVKELEAEGFNEASVLRQLKEQIRESYAAAPPEFIEEARKADMFNEALPPMSAVEIAAEFKKMAESGKKVVEKAMATPDFESLKPGRKRGPREKGNKIDIKKPTE